jgi:hypothetical protein
MQKRKNKSGKKANEMKTIKGENYTYHDKNNRMCP